MIRPVKDLDRPDHFMKPEAAMKHTIDKKLILDDLKKELPSLKSRTDTRDEHTEDVKKYQEHAGIWRGNCVRDYVNCDECGFTPCIYSKYAPGGKPDERKRRSGSDLLQAWKEGGMSAG